MRFAREDETWRIKEMWDYCFSDSKKFIDWNFSQNYHAENTLVYEKGDQICANLQLMPYCISFGGENIKITYISGVAVMPEHRSQGLASKLLLESFNVLRERNIPIAILVPFNYSFYEKYGFKVCYDRREYLLDVPCFKSKRDENFNKVTDITDEVIENLKVLYERTTENLNGYVVRTAENWRLILEDLLINSDGHCYIGKNSYIMYTIGNGNMEIYEIGYTGYQAKKDVFSFVSAHSAQVKSANINIAGSDVLYTEFCDNRNMRSVKPFAMARVIDVKRILEILKGGFYGEVCIAVNDDIIPENNKTFKVSNSAVSESGSAADLMLDISHFTMLASGYISLDEAKKAGYIKGNIDKADGLFKRQENYINLLL